MAKRICDPTSGKIGNQVYQNSRNGQIVRTRAIPTNPRTEQQVIARDNLKAASQAWKALTQAEMIAWNEAAAAVQSKARLGMSGPLTGIQYYVLVNAARLEQGLAIDDAVPAAPEFAANNATGLTVEDGGVVVTFGGALPAGMQLYAAAPVSPGVFRAPELVHLGSVPVLVGGEADCSALYTARFGAPPLGTKVFVAVKQQVNGLYGPTKAFNAVSAAA